MIRNPKRLARVFMTMWVISAVLSLAVTAGLIAVVVHFVAKFW